MTQKTKVQGLTTETDGSKMLPSFSADGFSRLQTFTRRFETMAKGWENTAWFAVTPYTYQCSIHTEVETMQFD